MDTDTVELARLRVLADKVPADGGWTVSGKMLRAVRDALAAAERRAEMAERVRNEQEAWAATYERRAHYLLERCHQLRDIIRINGDTINAGNDRLDEVCGKLDRAEQFADKYFTEKGWYRTKAQQFSDAARRVAAYCRQRIGFLNAMIKAVVGLSQQVLDAERERDQARADANRLQQELHQNAIVMQSAQAEARRLREALTSIIPILKGDCKREYDNCHIGEFEGDSWTWEETLDSIENSDMLLAEFEGDPCNDRVVAYRIARAALAAQDAPATKQESQDA